MISPSRRGRQNGFYSRVDPKPPSFATSRLARELGVLNSFYDGLNKAGSSRMVNGL